jgi:hypothetical protein
MDTLGSQVSVAVGGVNTGNAGQLTGVVCVTQVIVGGVISCTTIVRLHVDVFEHISVAVQVLVTLYVFGQEPGVLESEKVMETLPAQLSVAVGGANTGVAGQLIGVVWATQVMVGGILSNTKILCVHVAEFPHSSVAL